MSVFAIRLKELREEKELSIRALARALCVSDAAIRRWEKDERVPSANIVILVSKYFDVTSDYLLGLENWNT